MSEKTTILCVAPFNNPHIVPVYDQMAEQDGVEVTRASLRPLSKERLSLGWPEMPAESPYLQPWRRWSDRLAYWRAVLMADVVIFPGFLHNKTLPFHHWLRRLTGKVTLLWSEPFLGHHYRSRWKHALSCLLKVPCDWSNVHLLCIGGQRASGDYYVTGARRWRRWLFAFAVEPRENLDKDLSAVSPTEVKLVYCGSLIERKRVDLLIRALGRPELADGPWRLTILGDGEKRSELGAFAAELGIADKISFLGSVPREACDDVYASGDVLILPSRFDGWGAVVNEAVEQGMAVVCSHMVASSMLVEHGVSGYVFRSDDVEDLAGCLSRLVNDPSLVARMKQAGRDRIADFRPAESARRLVELCRSLMGKADMPEYSRGLCSPLPLPSALKA